jgi:hypothetical protein
LLLVLVLLLLMLLHIQEMLRPLLLLLPLVIQQCVQRVCRLTAAVQGCVQPLLRQPQLVHPTLDQTEVVQDKETCSSGGGSRGRIAETLRALTGGFCCGCRSCPLSCTKHRGFATLAGIH